MANYTLHLGFNWDSPQIGTLFAENTLDVRFLQFELRDDSDKPASFTALSGGDSIALVVYGLTGGNELAALVEANPSITLSFAFGPLDAQQVEQIEGGTLATYDPGTLVNVPPGDPDMQEVWTTPTGKDPQRVLQLTTTSMETGGDSPWGTALYTWTFADNLTFLSGNDNPKFEMGMALTVPTQGEPNVTRKFVADPEVIVGSGSTPT